MQGYASNIWDGGLSSRFTDGNQFGLGAEIGINTPETPHTGPMSIQHLTTKKYFKLGRGHIRE